MTHAYKYSAFAERSNGEKFESLFSSKDAALKEARHLFKRYGRAGVMREADQHIIWENGRFRDKNGW